MILITVLLLMLLQFIVVFEMTMVMPLAPIIAQTYGVLPQQVALLNLGFAASGLLSPFFGFLADSISMKRILQVSTLLFSIGSLVVYSNTLPGYILGRFLLGIGYFNLSGIIMSYTSVLVDNKKIGSIVGLYKIAFAVAAFVSPSLGSWTAGRIGFRTIYLGLSISGLLAVLALQALPDRKVVQDVPLSARLAFSLLKDRKAQLMIVANLLLSVPAIYFYGYLSVHLDALGLPQKTISVFYSIVAFGAILAGILITVYSDRFGKRKMSVWSTALGGVFLIPFILTKQPLWLFGFLFGLAYDTIWGLFYPTGATFYRVKSATFLTILSSTTSLANFFANATAPVLYTVGGFRLLMILSALGLLLSAYLMYRAFALDRLDHEVVEK